MISPLQPQVATQNLNERSCRVGQAVQIEPSIEKRVIQMAASREPMDYATHDQLLLDVFRRYGMGTLSRDQLLAIIAQHDSKSDPTSRAICAAARQALVMAAQRGG